MLRRPLSHQGVGLGVLRRRCIRSARRMALEEALRGAVAEWLDVYVGVSFGLRCALGARSTVRW